MRESSRPVVGELREKTGHEPADPIDEDFPTTARLRRVTANRLRAARRRGRFPSVDALLEHLCQLTEQNPSLLFAREKSK